jgi:hypothetical protein
MPRFEPRRLHVSQLIFAKDHIPIVRLNTLGSIHDVSDYFMVDLFEFYQGGHERLGTFLMQNR